MKKILLFLFVQISITGFSQQKTLPNIIIIYADDLGINDLSSYGSQKIKTVHIDRLANQGVRFINAYSTAATCTPSRYSLLTGLYPWRDANAQVLQGNSSMLIDSNNIAHHLKNNGYKTAVVGKWHLGLGRGSINWNEKISPSPADIGFDYSFIMAATNDRVPTVFVENSKVVNLEENDPLQVDYSKNFEGEPTGASHPHLLKLKYSHGHDQSIVNGISRIGYQKGGKKAMWVDENMGMIFVEKAKNFIEKNKEKPFFLYYCLHQPHVPRVPNPRFVGSTSLGARGDVIVEADWCVGQIINLLEKENLLHNTLIIFSSDNGPVLDDGYDDGSQQTQNIHKPWGIFKGGKYSMYNAGTNVPFIVYWKGVTTQKTSEALISQVDIPTSILNMLNIKHNEFTDGVNLCETLLGKNESGREYLLFEGLKGKIAIRYKNFVYIPEYKGSKMVPWGVKIETGMIGNAQLFDLKNDPQQKENLLMKNNKFRPYANKLQAIINSSK